MADIPRIIKFGYDNYKVDISVTSTSAKCKFCTYENKIITEQRGVTSNFVKHLRLKHPDRYVYFT